MESVLELRHITKVYPGVRALDDVSLSFRRGEVHALLGENGAGKSTLIKIIAGAVHQDAGEMDIAGESYTRIDPDIAKQHGIETVYQEFNLVDSLSVAENVCFGERFGRFVDYRRMTRKTTEIFEQMGVGIDPSLTASNLSTAQKQMVEIAKSISRGARILIMDEPSAPLSVADVEKMFAIVRRLRSEGVTIIYISHRLDEIKQISDRVTVLRDGKLITTLDTSGTDQRELTSLMVGRELSGGFPKREIVPGEVLLEVEGLTGNGDVGIDLSVRRGEIVGLAGLVGAGRTELARLVFGAEKVESGEIRVKGRAVRMRTPHDAIKNGIGLIPEDRKEQGCFLEKEIRWNIVINSLWKMLRARLFVDRDAENGMAAEYQRKLNIKTPSLTQLTKNLSGGNQQKVVLAKTLAAESDIVIFDEPTRGIDVGAKHEIYEIIGELAASGKAILMVTSEMSELIGLSDRIVVLYKGRIAGTLERDEFDQRRILELASGLE